jgi:hypothetical protein
MMDRPGPTAAAAGHWTEQRISMADETTERRFDAISEVKAAIGWCETTLNDLRKRLGLLEGPVEEVDVRAAGGAQVYSGGPELPRILRDADEAAKNGAGLRDAQSAKRAEHGLEGAEEAVHFRRLPLIDEVKRQMLDRQEQLVARLEALLQDAKAAEAASDARAALRAKLRAGRSAKAKRAAKRRAKK